MAPYRSGACAMADARLRDRIAIAPRATPHDIIRLNNMYRGAGAEDVLAALGERTRHAPAAVRVAVQKADARTAKLRSKPRKSGLRRSAGMAWKVATVAPMLLGAAKKVSTAKQHANGEGMSSKGRRKWRS